MFSHLLHRYYYARRTVLTRNVRLRVLENEV